MVCHPATRRERNEREKSVPNKSYPVEISTEVMMKHGTHISPHKPILCWDLCGRGACFAVTVPMDHPSRGGISPLKYAVFIEILCHTVGVIVKAAVRSAHHRSGTTLAGELPPGTAYSGAFQAQPGTKSSALQSGRSRWASRSLDAVYLLGPRCKPCWLERAIGGDHDDGIHPESN